MYSSTTYFHPPPSITGCFGDNPLLFNRCSSLDRPLRPKVYPGRILKQNFHHDGSGNFASVRYSNFGEQIVLQAPTPKPRKPIPLPRTKSLKILNVREIPIAKPRISLQKKPNFQNLRVTDSSINASEENGNEELQDASFQSASETCLEEESLEEEAENILNIDTNAPDYVAAVAAYARIVPGVNYSTFPKHNKISSGKYSTTFTNYLDSKQDNNSDGTITEPRGGKKNFQLVRSCWKALKG